MIQEITRGDSLGYTEELAQFHLKSQPIPEQTLTTSRLERLIEKLYLCLEIVTNSTGVGEEYHQIEDCQWVLRQLCRWICDIECAVLAQNLQEEYDAGNLLHQKART
jgi:hypothetical protein